MSDEMCILFFDVPTRQESKVCVFENDPMPTMVKSQQTMKKVMYAVSFKAIKLKLQKTKFSKKLIRELMLHHDNTSSHTAGLTVEFLKQIQIKVIEHPTYSLDLAMCDFRLFYNLKKNLRRHLFHSEEDIDVAINAFFSINF
ncbi:UNVERIFIED_CONTAM: Histone-lysine N-methyltransferase SETMAR [Trichonephila clavipes]